MSHSTFNCKDSKRGDDTLIIIVNSDGTLSVDPETLQKLLANQHQTSPISLVRLDAKNDGSDGADGDDDSRVNLTVEGYFPPTPSSSPPSPPPTPIADSNVNPEGGGSDVLADSITEILQPEDVEKLETALQSEHAKEILGDVLDMLGKNGEGEPGVIVQHGSVGLDHCYASLPTPPGTTTVVVNSTQSTRGAPRGHGVKLVRGRGGVMSLPLGASLVPVVKQLVMPDQSTSVTLSTSSGNIILRNPAIKTQATVSGHKVDVQVSPSIVSSKVPISKGTLQKKPASVSPQLIGAGDAGVMEMVLPKEKAGPGRPPGPGRPRGAVTRGGRGRGAGRGRGIARILPAVNTPTQTAPVDDRSKQLADEMAATVHALTLAENEQFAQIESMDQSRDADKVIPLVSRAKVVVKKVPKTVKKAGEVTPNTIQIFKPEKPQTPKITKKSAADSASKGKASSDLKKEEKVIVVSTEPQISPAALSAVVMSPTAPPVTTTSAATGVTPASSRTKYPKRENRKPPAHLAEAFGPALFSTPDIIRRVSTDKQTPTTSVNIASSKLEEELSSLVDDVAEPDSIMNTINTQVNKQEDQLLAEALLLEDLTSVATDDIFQDDNVSAQDASNEIALTSSLQSPPTEPTVQSTKNKPLAQTSLSSYFHKVESSKGESANENEATEQTGAMGSGLRKLPPVELPATRGATKRASLQKNQTVVQEESIKTPEVARRASASSEKRKSTDSKKSSESRKPSRSAEDDSEDMMPSDEVSDEEGNDEDDPNRLWCICKRPHNNRFMICCDTCEDWFHGKCVGVTKAMGEQMEEQEVEWMCPNCKKKKKQEEAAKKQAEGKVPPTKSAPPTPQNIIEEMASPPATPKEKKPEASKIILQHQKVTVVSHDTPKSTKGNEIRITKVSSKKAAEERKASTEVVAVKESPAAEPVKQTESPAFNPSPVPHQPPVVEGPQVDCIVCKKKSFPAAVYCSDECIETHATESLATINKNSVIVFEKKTSRIISGPNGPTPGNLTSWLMAHPSFQVMRPGVNPSSKFYNQPKPVAKQSTSPIKINRAILKQTTLQTKPQGVQLIAALPQSPTVEGPLKKNIAKAEPISPAPTKAKTPVVPKGQQQITHLLKAQQAKQDTAEAKATPAKLVATPPTPQVSKKPLVKEQKKAPQPTPAKKPTPTAPKKAAKEEPKKAAKEETKKVAKEDTKVDQKKEPEGRGKDFEEQKLRTIVKQTLQEVLATRLNETTDLKLTEEEVKQLVTQIEEELHIMFKETNAKYKAKYRSLIFNIKDKKNLTLFRKIADKSLSPVQLVQLTPEELASQELAQWREREARHQLEMIKKTELDLMQLAKTVVMKTHKGEQVVENEDGLGAKVLETSVEIEPEIKVTTPVTPTNEPLILKLKLDNKSKKDDKQSKKEKREDKHSEQSDSRRSSHKDSSSRSRSRHRSTHKSESDHRSRSKSRSEIKARSRSRTVDDTKKSKEKSESKREKRKHSHSEREKSKDRSVTKSNERENSKSRERGRSKSKTRERSKSSHRRDSKSSTRARSKSRSRDKKRSKSRDEVETSSASEEPQEINTNQQILPPLEITEAQESPLDAEVKEIISEVVEEEEEVLLEEPSSTAEITTPPFNTFEEEPAKSSVWKGTLEMPDVARFSTYIREVSGVCGDLEYDLPDTLNCVGRISPDTAWDYIAKMKKSGTKQILVVRFAADNGEDEMSYLSFYSYLSSRNRLGVVGNNSKMIKDFYILPLPSHTPVPQVLLPLDGPGFEDFRPHLLLGIIVRAKRKRLGDSETLFVSKVPKTMERSYTPPLPDEDSHTPTQQQQQPDTESFTPPHSPKPQRVIRLNPSTSAGGGNVSEDYVLEDDAPYSPEDEEDPNAPYSPGDAADDDDEDTAPAGPPSPGCSAELQRKVDKLNRMIHDIEQKKQEIDSLADPSQEIIMGTTEDDEEAYSPSGSLTPPPGTESSFLDKSSNISLPSDLQEIISSLKKKPEEPRSLDLDSDPIVQAYKTSNEPYSPEEDKEDQSEPETAPEPPIVQSAPSVKVNRDPRQRPAQTALSQLSDEEIIRKASEMGYMNPENPEPIPDVSRSRISAERPPGVDEEYNPFEAEHPVLQHPLMAMPIDSGVPFAPSMPPPHLPPFLPPNQFQPPPMFPPPMQSLHIPFTNPQPPPPQPLYPPPPPPQPAPLPPPPPSKSPERDFDYPRRRYSKKSKKESRETKSRKKKKRRYSESPPPKTKYNEKYERSRDRYSKKEKREKRETKEIWKSYGDSKEIPERKREPSWEYEEEPPMHLPPPMLPGPPPGPSQGFGIRGPMRGGPGPMRGGPNRGRFQRGMRGGFRGNFRGGPPMRGFHRGGFHQRGHPVGSGPPPGPSRNFQPPEPAFQNEYEEDIRRFEEQRLKEKNLERRKWRKESPPRKRRGKDDSD